MSYLLEYSQKFTFYYVKKEDENRMNDTDPIMIALKDVIGASISSETAGLKVACFWCFNKYKCFDREFNFMVVKSCLSPSLHNRISTHFSHIEDFCFRVRNLDLERILSQRLHNGAWARELS